MRNITSLCLAAFILSSSLAAAPLAPVAFDSFGYTGHDKVFEQAVPPGSYRNPILAGFYSDPSLCRVGDDFYLINSTFAYFPGIPIFHSRDLVHWKQIGDVIERPAQLKYDGLGVSRGIFAPSIRHQGDTFYVVCTMVDAGGNFLVTAKNPAGPWSDPVWFDFEGIDPSLFFDDDGRAWMINNGAPEGTPLYQGHRAIWLQEFDIKTQKLIGPRSVIVNGGVDISKKPVWIEGPHLYKRDGWYYLCAAEGGTSDNHSQVIFRSRSVTGPFVPWEKNPILTQRNLDGTVPGAVTSTGHADLVIGPDGNWWSVFLGCRPFAGKFYATGRETFLLPVTWTADGWPQVLAPGERVPYVVAAPKMSPATGDGSTEPASTDIAAGGIPLTGNFTWRDDFAESALSRAWMMLRTPKETFWKLEPSKGEILLTPRADTLVGKGSPAYLGRRLQHARFEVTTALHVPESVGVSAGLVAFQDETHHYYFAVRRTGHAVELFVERWNGDSHEILATTPLTDDGKITLRLIGDDATCSFSFATQPGQWQTIVSSADATVLTTQAAGGFVGATVGIHARIEE